MYYSAPTKAPTKKPASITKEEALYRKQLRSQRYYTESPTPAPAPAPTQSQRPTIQKLGDALEAFVVAHLEPVTTATLALFPMDENGVLEYVPTAHEVKSVVDSLIEAQHKLVLLNTWLETGIDLFQIGEIEADCMREFFEEEALEYAAGIKECFDLVKEMASGIAAALENLES
ncbi:hypothetical protein SR70_06650 [Klebsiella aerogenes]|uniref:hypothetical protein n=1 Tax=Klebsiella aerogenes TaxID=548 RepID=UPI0005EF2A39|nr:hypothetical protein [Klebsiella aerogenes]KJP43147.1 hypothetical protein SR70_06650 [Klebsiella aerogenes]